ncbi:hypothetical protein LOTGIDRAFT_160804 [Lottia gigantea]|uniref:Fibrinogen C-terminal domain-containing protein n=1 Tax=Lottia gigantea TaxID=225164 RepID=V4ADV8_LOTGI|nr:hypothetical protein LOTGIDRAFT_160804 [Lottia gigantea]ESO95042.1 hypothetical protein LOTGIDRAFT_160804 [Lottia gigantea]
MQFEAIVVILLDFVLLVFSSTDISEFRATKVLNDSCSLTQVLSVSMYDSPLLCARDCSQNFNCRRMMICTHQDGIECSLYIEGENCATPQPSGCSCFMKTYSKVNNKAICPIGLYGDNCQNTIKGCTQFMLRDTMCNKLNFNRNITEYIDGFGDANGDHWLGLTRIKEVLDNHGRSKLSVVLNHKTYCESNYNDFTIGAASSGYPIHLGQYQILKKNCGDSLKEVVNIEGSPFSSPGLDQTSFNCANNRHGSWWYANDSRCSESDLMGSRDAMYWPINRGNITLYRVYLRIKVVVLTPA